MKASTLKLPARIRAAQRANERRLLKQIKEINGWGSTYLPYSLRHGVPTVATYNALQRLLAKGLVRDSRRGYVAKGVRL